MYGNRTPPEDPPCETCRVVLRPENEDAARIYMIVRNQYIMGPSAPIDINHNPIHSAMELYEVRDKKSCFSKVLTLAHNSLEKFHNG